MRLIGITGGISTGKTTISNYLANTHHFPIFDADIYAREAVQLGSPILNQIIERYGGSILLPDGNLDRRQLGLIIFNHPDERRWLEQQIHPYVRSRFVSAISALTSQYPKSNSPRTAVLVIPLLFEANLTDLVTEIWVVYSSIQQQIDRLVKRDQLTVEQAQARIHSQMPMAEKCKLADVILDNSSTLEALWQQVDAAVQGNLKHNSSGS